MKRKLRILLIVFIVLCALAAFRAYPGIGIVTHSNLKGSVTDFSRLTEFMPSGTPAHSQVGLPHQFFESSNFWKSLVLQRRSIIHGHAFRPGERLSPVQLDEVGALLSQPATYKEWPGEAMCGGFHADFFFRWDHSDNEAIVCLGCGEVLLIRSGKKFRGSLKSSVHKRLIAIAKDVE